MRSEVHANAVCNFFEAILHHTVDEWYGKPFLLAPWEEQALIEVFGNVDESGNRIIETAYLEVPKKAGKTEFAAGIVLYVLATTNTPGCQVYGAAAATRQAMNVYRAACKMVEQSSILRQRLIIRRGTNRIVKRNDPDSFYGAIAADGDFGDGVNPSCVVADEVHRWKTRKQLENWDVLSNGGITRRQTLTIAITTAGVQNESPLAWRLHEKTRKINSVPPLAEDPKFFGRIYAAEKTDDPGNPATWIKANPSLKENGGFLDISKVREKHESFVAEGDLTSFKRYYLNIWDQKENRAIDMVKWDACAGDWNAEGLTPLSVDGVRAFRREYISRFSGRTCWAGVDLSMTTDLSAAVLIFPSDDDGYDVLPFFWMPEDNLRKRELRDGMPYGAWARDGFLELCPGGVIDYRDIRARLEWAAREFNLVGIYWDPWNSRQLSVPMIEDGFPCYEVRQGYPSLSEPTKALLQLIVQGKFHHGGHPVLRWNASCLCLDHDSKNADNVKPSKPVREKESSRIDGMAAVVDALYGAIKNEGAGYILPVVRSV